MNLHNMMMVLSGLQIYSNTPELDRCKTRMIPVAEKYLQEDRVWLVGAMLQVFEKYAMSMVETVPFHMRSDYAHSLLDFYFDSASALKKGNSTTMENMLDQFAGILSRVTDDENKNNEEVHILRRSLNRNIGEKMMTGFERHKKMFTQRYFNKAMDAPNPCHMFGLFVAKNTTDYYPNLDPILSAFKFDAEKA